VFAEFLLFLLVFPEEHTCVGLTVFRLGVFLVFYIYYSVPSNFGAVKVRWSVRFRFTRVQGERRASLITHSSMVTSMFA